MRGHRIRKPNKKPYFLVNGNHQFYQCFRAIANNIIEKFDLYNGLSKETLVIDNFEIEEDVVALRLHTVSRSNTPSTEYQFQLSEPECIDKIYLAAEEYIYYAWGVWFTPTESDGLLKFIAKLLQAPEAELPATVIVEERVGLRSRIKVKFEDSKPIFIDMHDAVIDIIGHHWNKTSIPISSIVPTRVSLDTNLLIIMVLIGIIKEIHDYEIQQ